MNAFYEEHPEFTRGLLSFTLYYFVGLTWTTNKLSYHYNDCDVSCEVGQTEPCGCTCTVDPFDWSDDEVGAFVVVVELVVISTVVFQVYCSFLLRRDRRRLLEAEGWRQRQGAFGGLFLCHHRGSGAAWKSLFCSNEIPRPLPDARWSICNRCTTSWNPR